MTPGRVALCLFALLCGGIGSESGAAERPAGAPDGAQWTTLFDGKSLGKWAVAEKYDFQKHGKIHVDQEKGQLILEAGQPGTAVRWTGEFPRTDYEVVLEAARLEGSDFFCGLTFPIGDTALTLVLGGWGGDITGLSNIDGEMAAENETCLPIRFQQGRWYHVRLRVTTPRIEVWLDQEKIIDLETEGRELGIYWVVEPCLPFGVATWRTKGALRDVRMRAL